MNYSHSYKHISPPTHQIKLIAEAVKFKVKSLFVHTHFDNLKEISKKVPYKT